LKIIVANDADISRLIEVVKGKHVKILFLDFDRDYEMNQMVITFTIRLFHKGVTNKLSHGIVGDLEASGYAIRQLQWGHK
jgi:hypothetical protein